MGTLWHKLSTILRTIYLPQHRWFNRIPFPERKFPFGMFCGHSEGFPRQQKGKLTTVLYVRWQNNDTESCTPVLQFVSFTYESHHLHYFLIGNLL